MQDDLRVREVLGKAAELPVSERAEYLETACGGDAALRGEVESLLRALDQAGQFLHNPTLEQGAPPGDEKTDSIGAEIGPYRLIEILGEGGMGVVYLAQQEQPVRRQVALKLIKPGMVGVAAVERFNSERQALALMDHSNIARVYDAGSVEPGRPYFVMELVLGKPITRWCDDNRLAPQQRLELFLMICNAVQHAHQKGIVHRDLKPGNVLVTTQDGRPLVKVIDFGISKAIAQPAAMKEAFTRTGILAGTPEYMSPEQAGGGSEEIDTRSDIYSLGVILYELMTGMTPLDQMQLREAGYDQMMRKIRETEPPKPSTRLSSATGTIAATSALRQMEPRHLVRFLSGDLDVIVMKALERERERRYATAAALARDVARFLNDDPVEAAPQSSLYIFSKFARKYRRVLSAIAAMLLVSAGSLVTIAVVSIALRTEAQHQRDIAIRALAAEAVAKSDADRGRQIAGQARARAEQESYFASIFAANAAVTQDNFADAQVFLDTAPQQFRGWEWNYLHAVANPQLMTFTTNGFAGAQYLKAQSEISILGRDRTFHFYDAQTGRELRQITAFKQRGLFPYAMSDDQQRFIAERKDYSICVTDRNATELAAIPLTKQRLTYIYTTHFTRDHSRFVTSCRFDHTVRIWETATCKELMRLESPDGLVIATDFSPDETKLLTASTQGVSRIWDLRTRKCICQHTEPSGGWSFSTFSPDGRRVLSTTADLSRQGVIWDPVSGKDLLSITEGVHTDVNLGVCFSPDGKLIGISGGRIASVFSAETGHLIATLRRHTGRVPDVQFIGDGSRLMTGSNDNTVRIWALHRPPQMIKFGSPSHPVRNVRFIDEGKCIAVYPTDAPPSVYDAAIGGVMFTIDLAHFESGDRSGGPGKAFDSSVPHIAFPTDTGTVLLVNPSTGKVLAEMGDRGAGAQAGTAAITSDGARAITCSAEGRVRIWNLSTAKETTSSFSTGTRTLRFTVNPQGDRLLTADAADEVRLWDLKTGTLIGVLPGGSPALGHPDDGRNIQTPHPEEKNQETESLVFSHDGKTIARIARQFVVLCDAENAKEIGQLNVSHAIVHSVCFSPDDSRAVVSCEDDVAEIWDVRRFTKIMLYGHQGSVTSACYSPDGTRVVTCSQDTTTRLWDASTGREILDLGAQSAAAMHTMFSPDGTKILTMFQDGTAQVWNSIPSNADPPILRAAP